MDSRLFRDRVQLGRRHATRLPRLPHRGGEHRGDDHVLRQRLPLQRVPWQTSTYHCIHYHIIYIIFIIYLDKDTSGSRWKGLCIFHKAAVVLLSGCVFAIRLKAGPHGNALIPQGGDRFVQMSWPNDEGPHGNAFGKTHCDQISLVSNTWPRTIY